MTCQTDISHKFMLNISILQKYPARLHFNSLKLSNPLDCWSDWLRLIDADRRMVHQTARQVLFESAFPFTEGKKTKKTTTFCCVRLAALPNTWKHTLMWEKKTAGVFDYFCRVTTYNSCQINAFK